MYLVVLNASELLDKSTQSFSLCLRLFARGQFGSVTLSEKKTEMMTMWPNIAHFYVFVFSELFYYTCV